MQLLCCNIYVYPLLPLAYSPCYPVTEPAMIYHLQPSGQFVTSRLRPHQRRSPCLSFSAHRHSFNHPRIIEQIYLYDVGMNGLTSSTCFDRWESLDVLISALRSFLSICLIRVGFSCLMWHSKVPHQQQLKQKTLNRLSR